MLPGSSFVYARVRVIRVVRICGRWGPSGSGMPPGIRLGTNQAAEPCGRVAYPSRSSDIGRQLERDMRAGETGGHAGQASPG